MLCSPPNAAVDAEQIGSDASSSALLGWIGRLIAKMLAQPHATTLRRQPRATTAEIGQLYVQPKQYVGWRGAFLEEVQL